MLSLGTDVVMVARFRFALQRTPTIRERLFTLTELDYAEAQADPAVTLAARFAAKEAVMKAMHAGIGTVKFKDIEIRRHSTGAPQVVLFDSALARQETLGIASWLVSLSHTDEVALAVAIGQA